MTTSSAPILQVLLVEDNPADARLTEEILKDSEHTTNLSVVEDGEDAMAYLRKEGGHSGAQRPDLILLDLMLPKMSGEEVLAAMNQDADLKTIPVMILTGTEAESSRLHAYNISPTRFCRKPISLDRFDHVVSQLSTLSQRPILLGYGRPETGRAAAPPSMVVAFRRLTAIRCQPAARSACLRGRFG